MTGSAGRGLAIVDLDNTLVRGSLLFHFGAWLVRERRLSLRPLLPFMLDETRYARRGGERAGMPQRVAHSVLSLVKGKSQAELLDSCGQFVHTCLPALVVPEVTDILGDLSELGIPVFLATASPQELADAVAAELGFAGALGTLSQLEEGHYTGRLASPIAHGPEKLSRVNELLIAQEADARLSWAFSDSINDLPILERVGWPVAVNADAQLRSIADERSWLTISTPRGRRSRVSTRPSDTTTSERSARNPV